MNHLVEIHDCPGYFVSRSGLVFSKKSGELKCKTLRKDHNGYLRAYLYSDIAKNRQHAVNRYVHVIVLEAFGGKRPDPVAECRHLDGNRVNNRAGNLTWGTRQENIDDTLTHGTRVWGERQGRAILTNAEVCVIKKILRMGCCSQRRIAAIFGVSPQRINSIALGKQWKTIG